MLNIYSITLFTCMSCSIESILRTETVIRHTNVPLTHLTRSQLEDKCRKLATLYHHARFSSNRRGKSLQRMHARVREFAKPTGTVGKLMSDWRWIESQGTLDDQATALVTYSQNLANATRHRLEVRSGVRKTLRGVRWGVITKKIFGSNKARGARSANRMMRATLGAGPQSRTVDRHVKEKTFLLDVENDETNIKAAAAFYKPLVEPLNLQPGQYIPFEIQADETGCNPEPVYCRRRRLILQLCGKVIKDGEGKHQCDFNCYPSVLTYDSVVEGVLHNVHATYITICLIRPLVYELPSMVIRARATCNSFDAAQVLEVQQKLGKLCVKHLAPIKMRQSGGKRILFVVL